MKYVDEFRDRTLIRDLSGEIHRLADSERHFRIMEVCGGHTHSIYRFALQDLLPPNVELIHGPGCPVCVLPMGRLDDALDVTEREGAVLTAFGDVMRVPGRRGTPLARKARGLDVRMVYSPLDALALARREADRHVIFFAIGFETTAPSTALTVLQAHDEEIDNFSVFSNHVTILPAVRAILDSPDMRIDGFIGPGHVSTVIGCRPFEFVPQGYGKPLVVTGFEPVDVLQGIVMILRQLGGGAAAVQNQYDRAVHWDGSSAALRVMQRVFDVRPFFEWRGLGFISQSALQLKPEFDHWNTERRFALAGLQVTDPVGAQCGEVLKGVLKPHQCRLFGTECTPERPIGALMVSSEGACAAHYAYAARPSGEVRG